MSSVQERVLGQAQEEDGMKEHTRAERAVGTDRRIGPPMELVATPEPVRCRNCGTVLAASRCHPSRLCRVCRPQTAAEQRYHELAAD